MDDVRPFFGERSEPLGDESLNWYTPQPQPQRGTINDTLDARIAVCIAEGICPWCKRDLDQDLFCSTCGLTAAAPRERRHTIEQQDDYVTTLPDRTLLQDAEEYSPAVVDRDEAA